MSFDRVKPDGWAVNEKLTSAQQNQLDVDHANAVDKTGDLVPGNINFSSIVSMNDGSTLVLRDGSALAAQSGSSAVFQSGSFLTIQSGGTLQNAGTISSTGVVNITSGTLTVGSGVGTTINSSVSFNGTTFYSQDATFLNDLIVDGDSTPGNVKLRIKDAAYLDLEALAKMRVLSGTSIEVQNGGVISVAVGGGISLTGDLTVNSGGSIEVAIGGGINVPGTLNLAAGGLAFAQPGSTTLYNAGSTLNVNTTPTLSAGITISGGTSSIAGTLSVSGTATISATTNLSGVTTIVGSTRRLKLTSRDVRRKITLAGGNAETVFSDGPGGYIDTQSPTYIANSDTLLFQIPAAGAVPHKYSVALTPPDNCILKSVEYTWTGSAELTVSIRRNGTSIGTTVTPAANGTITISPNVTVDRTTESYALEFVAEQATVANQSASVTSCFATYTVSEYDEG